MADANPLFFDRMNPVTGELATRAPAMTVAQACAAADRAGLVDARPQSPPRAADQGR